MRILDLFSGAGGAAMGLHRAFPEAEITGVDINPMPRYPFTFIQADALTFPLEGYDLIWASPPCQRYSLGAVLRGTSQNHPDLVAATRARLMAAQTSYIIENVERAPLLAAVTLCGAMFSLGVIRHRLFETNWPLTQPAHVPHRGTVRDGTYCTVAGHGGDGSNAYPVWARAMGIDWMSKQELAEAIPPAYSQYIGEQFAACCWEQAA